MLRLYLFAILIVAFTTSLSAQDLNPDEFLALGNDNMAKIDSILLAKGFAQKRTKQLAEPTIISYSYSAHTDTSIVVRSLHFGWRSSTKELDLQYAVYQKADANKFIRQLLQLGFNKTVEKAEGYNPGESFQIILYKRDNNEILYHEGRLERFGYLFAIHVEDYKP
jgi:hypothetical protein